MKYIFFTLMLSILCVSSAASQDIPGGWELSDEKFDNSVIESLKMKISDTTFKFITSVVVIKNGKVLIEEYFNGYGRDSCMILAP